MPYSVLNSGSIILFAPLIIDNDRLNMVIYQISNWKPNNIFLSDRPKNYEPAILPGTFFCMLTKPEENLSRNYRKGGYYM